MKHPGLKCSSCGSDKLKRSHGMSLLELPKMALGSYPFRCLDCRARTWINVWSLSRGKDVTCPRCLSMGVSLIEPERLRLGVWGMLRIALGARAYRCNFCNARFLSKKRLPTDPKQRVEEPSEARQPAMNSAATVSD